MSDRVPPHNLDAEIGVIGGILLRNEAYDWIGELSSDVFFHPQHRAIYEAMVEVHENRGEPIDVITVQDELRRRDKKHEGLDVLLADMASRVPTAENIGYYARIVREKAALRLIIRNSSRACDLAFAGDGNKAAALIEQCEYRSESSRTKRKRFLTAKDMVAASTMRLRSNDDSDRPILTGFTDLDAAIGGLRRRRLLILGGRPGAGKTTVQQCIVDNLTARGICVGVISLEEEGPDYMDAQIGRMAGIDSMRVVDRNLTVAEYLAWDHAAAVWAQRPVVLCEERNLSMRDIVRRARVMKREHDIQGIVIDYREQVARPGRRKEHEEIADQLAQLLEALQELDLFGMLMSQLNREVMHDRKGPAKVEKRPQVHHLNGAGALEAFAYQILLMHRECMFNKKANGNIAECIVGKAKRGRTGTVEMLWVPHLPAVRTLTPEMRDRFAEMEQQQQERQRERKQPSKPIQGSLYEGRAAS